MSKYRCAECGGEITVRDNAGGGLITVNVDGHARAAHRACPPRVPSTSEGDAAVGRRTVPFEVFDATHPDHEFTEDLSDGSMCMCGIPALAHD
jgi:hypothetical protein